MTPWEAPFATGPVKATVSIPGSKSATARALVLSALADEPGSIAGGLGARDTDLMIAGLRTLGAIIDKPSDSKWSIQPIMGQPSSGHIDCGLAGTVMRFLPPIAGLGLGTTSFHGDYAASNRPLTPLVKALIQLGVQVEGNQLPIKVTGPVIGSQVIIDSSSSSQFISALLMAGPRFPKGITITHQGRSIPSLPHIEMTIAALAHHGVQVYHQNRTWEVCTGSIAAIDEVIEPDLTTAAVFMAAAVVTAGRITIPSWPVGTTQPGARIIAILNEMGATTSHSADGLSVSGAGQITGVDIDLHDASELTPVVAGLAALAKSATRIRGVAHIRGHESNRLDCLSHQINAIGGDCHQTSDGLIIHPRTLRPGIFQTHADHRLAHTGALIGLAIRGISLDDVGCTSKTMPGFPTIWKDIVR